MIIEFEDSFIRKNQFETLYSIEEKLGEGSFGEVFKVKYIDSYDDKYNAIKKIKFKNENEREILKELEIYAKIMNIEHKNIVKYVNFWIEKNSVHNSSTLYFQMELCEQTLTEFIKNIQEFEFEESNYFMSSKYFISSALFIEILEGVNYFHKQKPPLIHRDLCPDNILIKLEENNKVVVVKIADFGLVTIHKYTEQLHEPSAGHIKYIAPEALRDGGDYDTRADIYSLGVILNDLIFELFDIYSDKK
jgi:serine/threonine protein kinase